MSLRNSITSPLNLTTKPFPSIAPVWLQPHQNRLLIRERVEDRRNPCSGISCPNKNTRDGSKRVGITVACLPPPPKKKINHNYHQHKHTLGSSPFLLVTKNTNVAYVRLPRYLLFIQTEQTWDSFVTRLLRRNATRKNLVFFWYCCTHTFYIRLFKFDVCVTCITDTII